MRALKAILLSLLLSLAVFGEVSQDLMRAISRGQMEKVKEQIETMGQNVNDTDRRGNTPLMEAIRRDQMEIAKYLVEKGADINYKRDERADSPLSLALFSGKSQFVKMLIENGANTLPAMNKGATPLFFAIAMGNVENFEEALNDGEDIFAQANNFYPLDLACMYGNNQMAEKLIDLGADVNSESRTKPLGYAVENGNVGLIKLLIDSGARINDEPGGNMGSALNLACNGGASISVIQELIKLGANATITNSRGQNALRLFVDRNDNEEVVKSLLKAGCDPTVVDNRGESALSAAKRRRRYNIIHLLQEGAIMNAAKDGKKGPIIQILNEQKTAGGNRQPKKIDINSRLSIGERTPLMWAAMGGNVEVIKLLIEKGAEVNACDIQGTTPIMFAAGTGNVDALKFLAEKGAKINAEDNRGRTALSHAKRRLKFDAMDALREMGAK